MVETRTWGGGRHEAQQRAEQVASFRRELEELQRDAVLDLSTDDRARVERYHQALLEGLSRQFDVDSSDAQRRMSLGMRIASLLGAITLSAGVVLFFYRIWGLLATPAQVAILAGVPLIALVAVDVAARRERTLYVASVLAALATVAFVLDLNALGAIFNLAPTPWVLLPCAAFALAVACAYGLRLLLGAGLVLGVAFVHSLLASLGGLEWSGSAQRPEPLIALGGLVLLGSFTRLATRRSEFSAVWRLVGTVVLLLPVLFLSVWTEVFSYLLLPLAAQRAIYDVAGFALPLAGIWAGIRRRWPEVLNTSTVFLVLFVYAKCFDWWWEFLPRYLFFLVLGLLSIAALVFMGRIRLRLKAGAR